MSIQNLVNSAGKTEQAFKRDSPIGTTVQGQVLEADVRQVVGYEDGKPETWDDGSPKQQVRVVLQTNQRDAGPEDDGRRAVFIKWWGDTRKACLEALKQAGDDDIRVGGMFMARYAGDRPNENARMNPTKLFQYAYQRPAQGAGLDMTGQQVQHNGQPVNTSTGEVGGYQQPAQQQQQPAPVQQQQTDPWGTPMGQPVQQQQYQQPAPVQQQQPAQQQTDPWGTPVGQMTQQAAPVQQQAAPAPGADAFGQLGATPIQQAQAQQVAPAPAAPQINLEQVRGMIAAGMDDMTIQQATGASFEVLAGIRNLP